MSVAIDGQYESELVEVRDPLVDAVVALRVVDQPSYELMGSYLTEKIKPMIKQIHKDIDPTVEAANKAHKTATALRKKLLDPLLTAEALCKESLGEYEDEQERLRAAEIKRLDAEREERQRAADAAARKQAEEDQLDAAQALSDAGDLEGAEALLEKPTSIIPEHEPAPPVSRHVKPVAQGVSSRKTWEGEVVDESKLILAVVAGKVPANVLKIDNAALQKHIRANDGQVDYPGVRISQKRVMSGRAS